MSTCSTGKMRKTKAERVEGRESELLNIIVIDSYVQVCQVCPL